MEDENKIKEWIQNHKHYYDKLVEKFPKEALAQMQEASLTFWEKYEKNYWEELTLDQELEFWSMVTNFETTEEMDILTS